ncbi:MAG TPA: RNA-binding protein [Verrucomicrobiae bacterium]|nr:RNA-binding protein [Verrucomicrobiae bacterium]
MAQKLFVNNLAWETTSESLAAHFAPMGDIEEAIVVQDRDSGRSRGYGFVTFKNDEDGKKAVDQLNGSELDGRNINVNEARPREERPRRDYSSNGNQNGGGSFRQRSW